MTPLITILRSGIKAVGFFGGGVIVARDFAYRTQNRTQQRRISIARQSG
jgi:hypothetical protein